MSARTRRRERRALGFTPIVPSVDPVSIGINAAIAAAFVAGKLFHFHAGQHEADQIVVHQNDLGALMDEAAAAGQRPDVTLDELVWWRDTLVAAGAQFEELTYQFARAGPGARETMFGNPGYLRRLIADIEEQIKVMANQLGYDWNKIFNAATNVISILKSPTGRTPMPMPMPQPGWGTWPDGRPREYPTTVDSGNWPDAQTDWTPYLIGGGVLVALLLAFSGGRR